MERTQIRLLQQFIEILSLLRKQQKREREEKIRKEWRNKIAIPISTFAIMKNFKCK